MKHNLKEIKIQVPTKERYNHYLHKVLLTSPGATTSLQKQQPSLQPGIFEKSDDPKRSEEPEALLKHESPDSCCFGFFSPCLITTNVSNPNAALMTNCEQQRENNKF